MNKTASIVIADIIALCGLVAAASAQDSVAQTPGNSDALPAYSSITTRYVVDLAPITGSWGSLYYVGPVLKASRDPDALFPTQVLGAAALSPDRLTSVSFASTSFSTWSTPGQGVNPTENAAPGSVAISGYDRQFGLASNDLSAAATNLVGARIGQNEAQLGRLYVTRTVAASSRISAAATDSATLSLGAIDANANLTLRADDFNVTSGLAILGENILRIDLLARNTLTQNSPFASGGTNASADPGATTFLINNETVTTNTPTAAPESLAGSPLGIIFDFAATYRPDGAAGITSHTDPSLSAHRGNPSFHAVSLGAGIGTVASIAKQNPGANPVNSINLFEIDASGNVLSTDAATLPSPITAGAFSTNSAGDAQFLQYLSQVCFRGANGQVGLGADGADLVAAATATDPTDGEFIAVATFSGGAPTWTVAAYEGKQVLDAMNGSPIGSILASSPATFSAPAVDLSGNVYFVAAFDPTVGANTTGFFKAVNTPTGYQLELIFKAGDAFLGPNSARTYTIDDILLADSNSIASGSFHSSSILQPLLPGVSNPDPQDSEAFGGAVVNVKLTYNNAGTPESYQAALFIGPDPATPPTGCDGDANGDGAVDVNDIS
ncbi:MAG: hypothetical protein KDA21_04400, partial [Phycisphaerales bacterium]|nr:hypothetical protein [Phycisphaerales bacterium]